MALKRETAGTDEDQPVVADQPVAGEQMAVPAEPAGEAAPVTPAGEGAPVTPAEPAESAEPDGLGEWVAGNHGPRHGAPAMDADPASPPRAAAEGLGTGTGDSVPAQAAAVTGGVTDDREPDGPGDAGAALITDEPALREGWLKIQSGFVDDPRGAVTEAAGFISDVTGTLVTALQDRERALRRSWEADGTDTEGLRNAIREYRSFFEVLVKL